MDLIYHITSPEAWTAAQTQGEIVAESLMTEGFIHCSRQEQLLEVATRFFAAAEALLVTAIDERAVAPWLVNEGPAGTSDPFAAEVFPHVYGPIPVHAVVAVAPLRRDDAGNYVWPDELPRSG